MPRPTSNGAISLTGRNDIVNDEDPLSWSDGVLLHLKVIFTVLFRERGRLGGTGQFPGLAHRHETSTESQGQARAEQEATSVEADDDVGFRLLAVIAEDVQLQGSDQGLVQCRIGEDGQDVFEEDARRGEVRKLTDGVTQSYLKTGEFGGAGGSGGGESGVLGGVSGGIWRIWAGV